MKDSIKNNPRKKVIVAAAAVLFVLLLCLILSQVGANAGKDEGREGFLQPIPEAEESSGPETKTDGYRSGSRIDEYWESLGVTEETLSTSEPEGDTVTKDPRHPGSISVEDLFGDCEQEIPEKPAPKPRSSGGGGSGGGSSRASASAHKPEARDDKTVTAPSDDPATQVHVEKPQVQVKRTGAISSLDEDVASDLGNGFSTLDGTDRWVSGESGKPYRCMFTRDEKVRSGQRVTVRLMEDLIIGGVHVPKNTHIQGVCNISDRMELSFSSIDMGGKIVSFSFQAYDTDGGRGIYCSDISKTTQEVTNQGLSTITSTLNSRLGRVARDAAAVGASIARSKSGEVTVSIPAGYTFYIVEEKR